jgi:hypothetical protein
MRNKFLLKHQSQFIQSPFLFPKFRFHIMVAGYGAGKSSGIAAGVENCIKMLQGKRDVEGRTACVMLGGASLSHLEKTTLGMIKEDLDMTKTIYFHDKKNNVITVGTVRLVLVSLSEPQKIVGFNAWASFLDEVDDLGSVSASDDVTFEAIRAANERTRQKIEGMRKAFICMGSTSQGQKGLYRVYTQFVASGQGFILIRGSTRDNPHLDPDYVESLYKTYNDTERLVFLEGHFLPISQGRVIPDFDWARNWINEDLDQDIGRDEVVYWAQDFNTGYNRGCAAVTRGGKIFVVKRYEFPDIQHAPKVLRHDFPTNKIIFLPDATAKDQITHFLKELKSNSIHWAIRKKNPLVEDGVFLVNKLLFTRRLQFGKMAKASAEACALAQRDKNGKVPKGIGPNSPIHDVDAVRMVCYFIASNVATMRDMKRITIARHQFMEEEDPNDGIKELQDGYTELSPAAL